MKTTTLPSPPLPVPPAGASIPLPANFFAWPKPMRERYLRINVGR